MLQRCHRSVLERYKLYVSALKVSFNTSHSQQTNISNWHSLHVAFYTQTVPLQLQHYGMTKMCMLLVLLLVLLLLVC